MSWKNPKKKSSTHLFTYSLCWFDCMDSDFNFTYFLFQVSQPTICGLNFELKSNLPHLTTKTRGAATVSSVARTKPKTSSSLVFLGACKHFSKTPQICHKPRVGTKKKIYNRSSVKIWVLHTIPASDNQEFFFSIQTNLVWLNVESPNSGSWRMQQKKGKLIFLKNGLLWDTPNNHQRGGLQSHSHII